MKPAPLAAIVRQWARAQALKAERKRRRAKRSKRHYPRGKERRRG